MPNTFAYLTLFIWPVVVVILFRRLPAPAALCWSIILGYLLLPGRAGIDLPVLPVIDKHSITAVTAALMCFVAIRKSRALELRQRISGIVAIAGESRPVYRRGQVMFHLIIVVLFVGPFLTVLTNTEALPNGGRVIPGARLYDAFSIALTLLMALLPFAMGRRFLASRESHLTALRVFAVAAMAYSLFVLYEVKMSPQMNNMVYGFFPHDWSQHVRGSGFRPLVFLNHGLWLAIFMAMSTLAAFALFRAHRKTGTSTKWMQAGIWLLATLVLSKSLGALLIVLMLLPVILFFNDRLRLLIAAILAACVLFYPMLRGADLVPTDAIYSAAQSISEERADSLGTRLDNEDVLLAHAQRKPLFGWGGWGRSRVFDENGKDISTTDGYWVIVISTYGWLGYLAQFGLLTIPIILLGYHRRKLQNFSATAGLALVMTAALVDLIPNATISPLTWLIAGAMMGRYQSATFGEAPEENRRTAAQSHSLPVQSPPVAAMHAPQHIRQPRA